MSGSGNFESFDLFYKYAKEVEKYPLLSKKAEVKLLQKIVKGDEKALEKLICSNLRFVIKIAFMYRGKGLDISEIINEGNLGLIRAAREFNTDKNVRFITYAVWWVRQAIGQALNEKSRTVRIPAYNEMILGRISKSEVPIKQFVGGETGPDLESLSKNLKLTPEKVTKVLRTGSANVTIDTDTDKGLVDSNPTQDNIFADTAMREFANNILENLKPREKKVLQYFFGLKGHKIMNLREISELLNISRERVRQIKEAALDKLRDLKIKREIIPAS